MEKFRMGIIGTGNRGRGLQFTMLSLPDIEVVALCDEYLDKAEYAANENFERTGKKPFVTTDYREVLAMDNIDGVCIATAWEPHIPLAIAAMKAGIPVCMEVGGAYSLYDCHELVRVYEETKTPFMMLENCCFDEAELWATAMVRNGLYGEVVHCSGAYAHDLRWEILTGNQERHYRLRNYTMRNCENYQTHELGPIAKLLGINRGNRMVSLVSVGSKARGLEACVNKYKDKVDPSLVGVKFNQADIVTTVITCANGETIQLRLDTSLPRVYDREFTVHGTNMYSRSKDVVVDGEERWRSMNEPEFLKYKPGCWAMLTEEDKRLGHGGMDGIEFRVFVDALRNGEEMPIDVYDAASWMAISCLTETSIAQGGMPQAIPDFTHGEWLRRPIKDVVPLPIFDKEEK